MSDQVSYVPSANEGTSCVSGTTYTASVCPSGISYTDADTSGVTACTSGVETVWLYLSTWSTSAGNGGTSNPFAPPTSNGDAANGIQLGSALTVAGTITNTFVIDTVGGIATTPTGAGGSDECSMSEPTFTFE